MSDSGPRVDDRTVAALIEALAEPLAERIGDILGQPYRPSLVTAAELGKVLGVTVDTVYRHKKKLGVVALGDGERPRLRFDVDTAMAAWAAREPARRTAASPVPRRGSRRRRLGANTPLLPVRGKISEQALAE